MTRDNGLLDSTKSFALSNELIWPPGIRLFDLC